jgi:hypothetical protein
MVGVGDRAVPARSAGTRSDDLGLEKPLGRSRSRLRNRHNERSLERAVPHLARCGADRHRARSGHDPVGAKVTLVTETPPMAGIVSHEVVKRTCSPWWQR